MEIRFVRHALERIRVYGISAGFAENCLKKPDRIFDGKNGRKIAQKRLNGYVMRIIYEEKEHSLTVITVYKARAERYEI
ncbi:MAG: DUF4258 domain-containing protein [Candidatus Diapherotrites archaeon]|nr:DUF4258 domain-containing protein [Candidatus Diapherotrites archaeon]